MTRLPLALGLGVSLVALAGRAAAQDTASTEERLRRQEERLTAAEERMRRQDQEIAALEQEMT